MSPISLANYIIICDLRIRLQSASTPRDKLAILSDGATRLVQHIDALYALTDKDTKPVSDLQHDMMEKFNQLIPTEVDEIADRMLALLEELEDKYE